jgi:hypothetical protein
MANLRAIQVQLYASHHTFNALFLQAGSSAMIAFGGTGMTSFDARLKLFIGHAVLHKKSI